MSKYIIYGRPASENTQAALAKYGHDDVTYVDVSEDQEAMKKMLEHSGGKKVVPVIVEEDSGTVEVGNEGNT